MPNTNVLIAGLQSKRGQSYRLLQLLYESQFEISISVPLILEYEGDELKLAVLDGKTIVERT